MGNPRLLRGAALSVLVSLAAFPQVPKSPLDYDVVVAGAGAGGVSAALQAARLGARVALLEETDWIGGQMTAGGVSTMDEAGFNTDSGIYAEFSDRIKIHYARSGKSVGTCYSSARKICFEPGVGRAILEEMMEDTRRRFGDRARKRVLDLYLRRRVVHVTAEGESSNRVCNPERRAVPQQSADRCD